MTGFRLVGVGAVLLSAAVSAAELNTLRDLKVLPAGGGAQVVLQGSRTPTFSVFRLNEPDRLVVDVSGADAKAIEGHAQGAGPVTGVVTSQFTNGSQRVGRLTLALDGAGKYDVRAEGTSVVISVDPAKTAQRDAAAPTEESVAVAPAEPKVAPAKTEQPREPGLVASQVDEVQVKDPAHRLTRLEWVAGALKVHADGEVAKFEILELSNPPRLAVDLFGLRSSAKGLKPKGALLREVRVGSWPDKVRLVLDMAGPMPAYRASRTAGGLTIALKKAELAATPAAAAEREPAVAEIDGAVVPLGETAPTAVEAPAAAARAEVTAVDFTEEAAGGRVELALKGTSAWKLERPDTKSAVLTLEAATLPRKLERSLDTEALETPIKMVSAFTAPGAEGRVRVVVAAGTALQAAVVKTPRGLSLRLTTQGSSEAATVDARTAAFNSEAEGFAQVGAAKRRYVGQRVTFEFKDIDIHNLLRIIAEISKKNIVVSDDVSGKVTVRLRNVPWDQALDLVLRSKGLGQEDLGNIIRVAPLKVLQEEANQRADRLKAIRNSAALSVQLVPVNYQTATDMASRVKEILTERGTVSVDQRTNTLIVRDLSENFGKVRSLVATLDLQTPQVLIEARIVEANTSFTREVGVQWGGRAQAAPGTGNATGLAFPNSIVASGAAGDAPAGGTAGQAGYAVNLPVGIGSGVGGGLGFIFGSAGGALQLNLRLSAAESQGLIKTISAPKVTTLDNVTARISQGLSVPFSQTSAAGVNTTFIEARLQLEVTPHITQDGSVLMAIRAENNQPDPSTTGANGQPAIQRKEAITQVMVKDGDTTVIGGIYTRRTASSNSSVPFFGKIPVLGFFFRNNRESDSRQELLIFITPRILNRQTIAQTL